LPRRLESLALLVFSSGKKKKKKERGLHELVSAPGVKKGKGKEKTGKETVAPASGRLLI